MEKSELRSRLEDEYQKWEAVLDQLAGATRETLGAAQHSVQPKSGILHVFLANSTHWQDSLS